MSVFQLPRRGEVRACPRVSLSVFLCLLLASCSGSVSSDSVSSALTDHTLRLSFTPDRASPTNADGALVSGDIFVFVDPESDVRRVVFSIDGNVQQTENFAPFDLGGTAANDDAIPFKSAQLVDGEHTISAAIELVSGGSESISAVVTVNNGNEYSLLNSPLQARTGAVPLSGATVSGDVHVFLSPETGVRQVQFFLDDPMMLSPPIQVENLAPYDFAGTARDRSAISFDTSSLAEGAHDISARVVLVAGGSVSLNAAFTIDHGTGNTNRPPIPEIDVACSELTCDFDATASADPDGFIVDYAWDFGDGSGSSLAVDSHLYAAAGSFTVALTVTDDQGATASTSRLVSVSSSGNAAPQARFGASCSGLSCEFDGTASSDADGFVVDYAWDFGDGGGGFGSATSNSYSAPGNYTVSLTVTDNEGVTGSTTQTVSVSSGTGCPSISSLDCEQVRKTGDFVFSFGAGAGGVVDKNGAGTGFTMVDPPSSSGNPFPSPEVPGHWPDRIEIDPSSGELSLEATAGIQHRDNNNLDNALGVGLNLPSATITMSATVVNLPAPPGGWAQAGLWFGSADDFGRGTSEDNYIKLVVASKNQGAYLVEASLERDAVQVARSDASIAPAPSAVTLKLVTNPASRSVEARYDAGGGETPLAVFSNLPDEWFSFDQAGIDPNVSTRSYGGIFATSRNAPTPQTFRFAEFEVTEAPPIGGGGPAELEFDRWTVAVSSPTGLAWGPDNRLYVAELFGTIRAFELDKSGQTVLSEQIIDAVTASNGGSRLLLGLAVDPESTPDRVILWAGHSDGSVNNGQENSGKVSRIEGPSFLVAEDVIVGLPRAIANHALNNIEFGPDGRLYLAMGGNTGAGAANSATTEFGNRPEQPLSAAVLVADVNDASFQGQCATPIGQFGVPFSCDVQVLASGLRNSYDVAWHRNGQLYATDNGLGVVGTVPPTTTPPCTAFGNPAQDNPGPQPDLLLRIEPGKYYGHPNPYRNECVFKDGTFQGATPLPNYEPPMFVLGQNLSANSILEYTGDAFFSKLMGELLISNFSRGDNITRTRLTPDGMAVVASMNLVSGFSDPLPLAQDPSGTLYVGELNANRVAVLQPLPLTPEPVGSWAPRAPVPASILDAGSGTVDGKLYMVGGKTSSQYISSVFVYDPVFDDWSSAAPLPGPAVENPAVTSFDGKLYAFGGSTAPFSGAVTNAAVYDPDSGAWTPLPPMSIARGGANAQVLDGRIYVIGGMGADGASLASVEVFDPVSESWTPGVGMLTRRDNPGAAVFGDELFIFGGRTRNADGSGNTLATVEVFDSASGTWAFGASMPTARRTMSVGTISGRAQVIGGEAPATAANEEYDPSTNSWRTLAPITTSRHGAARATIRGSIYVAGGGPRAGSSFTDDVDVFAY